jgi:septal ring factor EnvC (AmiA/AmiB activator)
MLLKVRPVVVQEVSAFLVNTKTLTGIIPSHAMHVNIKNERCMTLCREDGLVPVVNRQSMKSLRAFKNETTLLNKMTSVNGLVDFCQLQTNIMEDIRTWHNAQSGKLIAKILEQDNQIAHLESQLKNGDKELQEALTENDKLKEQLMKLQSRLDESEVNVKYANLLEVYNMAEAEIKQLKEQLKAATASAVSSQPRVTQTPVTPELSQLINHMFHNIFDPPSNSRY